MAKMFTNFTGRAKQKGVWAALNTVIIKQANHLIDFSFNILKIFLCV